MEPSLGMGKPAGFVAGTHLSKGLGIYILTCAKTHICSELPITPYSKKVILCQVKL